MTKVMVFCESWQIDCCGDPFKIGDEVEWDCNKSDDNDWIKEADYYYESHLPSVFVVRGIVAEIYNVTLHYENKQFHSYSKKPIEQVDRFKLSSGFLAVLHNATITKE